MKIEAGGIGQVSKTASALGLETPLNGDSSAENRALVGEIYTSHHRDLLRFLRRRVGSETDASDLAQEAYVRLCTARDLRRIRGKERAFLFRIATNLLRDARRRWLTRGGAQHLEFDETLRFTAAAEETPESLLGQKETLVAVKQALRRMDPKTRQVYLLRRVSEHPYSKIAQQLGVSVRTVERRMHRALQLLKEELLQPKPEKVL